MDPLVSVITPTYNHERYIDTCIQSVIDQTYTNWEMIVIDDGSTDTTYLICEKYAAKDTRVTVFTQENVGLDGLSKTYNYALERSRGSLLAILEGDDYWLPNKLRVSVDMLKKDKSVLCFGAAFTCDHRDFIVDGYPKPSMTKELSVIQNIPTGNFLNLYLLKSFIPSPSIVVVASAIRSIGGFLQPQGMRVVDYPTVLRLATLGRFSFVDEPLCCYRIMPSQASSSGALQPASAASHAIEFFDSLDGKVLENVNVSRHELCRNLGRRALLNHFHIGRTLLVAGKYREARKHFLRLLKSTSPSLAFRGLLGLGASFLTMDIEGFARIVGRRALR